MKQLIWVLLVALGAMAMAQDAAIEQLAANSRLEVENPMVINDPAAPKTAEVLKAVEAVVASLSPSNAAPAEEEPAVETEQPVEEAAVAEEGAAEEETPSETADAGNAEDTADVETETPVEASEAAEDEATPTAQPEEEVEEETKVLTKKEKKAVAKYNEAVDQVLVVLSKQLEDFGAIPITIDEQTLLALDAVPEPVEEESETPAQGNKKRKGNNNRAGNKNKKKNKKNKRKNNRNNNDNRRKNRTDDDDDDDSAVEQARRRASNERNSNEKGNNRNSNEKGNKKNKNKRKNNKNKRNKNKNAKNRKPKALGDDEEDEEMVEEGRRKTSPNRKQKQQNKRRNNNRGNNKNKKNKNNKKNRNNKNNNKGRADLDARESGPTSFTNEERSASNARVTGITKIARDGDVTVNLSGKREKVKAVVTVGPLSVNLKDKSRALTRAQLETTLTAEVLFKVKSVSRRDKINLQSIEVLELTPEEISVARSDLELEPEVITTAQKQVAVAIDTARVGRILAEELDEVFDKENIIQNLENHPFLQD